MRKIILSIQASVSKTKDAVLKVKEGDDIDLVANSFCKAYGLGKDQEYALVKQL